MQKYNQHKVTSRPASANQVQTKLNIGKPNDHFEREADRVADRVVSHDAASHQGMQASPQQIQTKCGACAAEEKIQKKGEEEEVQAKPKMGGLNDTNGQGADQMAKQVASAGVINIQTKPQNDSSVPFIQRSGISETIPEDLSKGYQGSMEIKMKEWRKINSDRKQSYGGLDGWVKFLPSKDPSVPDSDKIGLVQIAKVFNDETDTNESIVDKHPTASAETQTQEDTNKGVEGGFFMDKDLDQVKAGKMPHNKYYIDQEPGAPPGRRTYSEPGKPTVRVQDQHGFKNGTKTQDAVLTDKPNYFKDSIYTFETYAQSDTHNYAGIRWGFKMSSPTSPMLPLSKSGMMVDAKIESTPVTPLFSPSATYKDTEDRYNKHAGPGASKPPASQQPGAKPKPPPPKEPVPVEPPSPEPMQRKEENATRPSPRSWISSSIQNTKGQGQKMDTNVQGKMEKGIGADFSRVNIHTDTSAIQMSKELNAKAFTVGNDIYFNKGEYSPGSKSGQHLLAHELTHTVQQGASAQGMIQKQDADEHKHDPLETDEEGYTFGRAPHDHKPGNWAAVQSLAKMRCVDSNLSSYQRMIECNCAFSDPGFILINTIAYQMFGSPLAQGNLIYYASGAGGEKTYHEELKKMIEDDENVRSLLIHDMKSDIRRGKNSGHFMISQNYYDISEYQLAFGGIDRVDWQFDPVSKQVTVWFKDPYDFHPVYPVLYEKFKDNADEVDRPTNCVHAAMVELQLPKGKLLGAKPYIMKAKATFDYEDFDMDAPRPLRQRPGMDIQDAGDNDTL